MFLLVATLGCGKVSPANPDAAMIVGCTAGGAHKANGQACGCTSDCASGFCVDGVCCDSACGDTCKVCNNPRSPGVCSFVPNGAPPRKPELCAATDATTCGLDGMCNGAGACRNHPTGTVCAKGKCDASAVKGEWTCDGAGTCQTGSLTLCAPFGCDEKTNACAVSCASDDDCAPGRPCVAGSCGVKSKAAACKKNEDCATGFCTDGVCCSTACQGSCVACNVVGRLGTCWPIDPGLPDPHGVCKDEGATSCGHTGTCDGFGGCAMYPAETICSPPTCAGSRLETAGTCNGAGTCRAPGVQNCWPYKCSGTSCGTKCATDDDCQPGHACVDGSCGPKQPGQSCGAGTECASGFCVDGVCCMEACDGACQSCALPSSMGRCAPVPAGAADSRGKCADQGAASCGTDGACDGAGACRRYKAGTECKAERCVANVYTPPSSCNGTGLCVASSSLPCAPYTCNGARCFSSCETTAQCVVPSTCVGNSCGKKLIGAFCSTESECASGFCAQGVCCSSACTAACKSCAITGAMGQCVNVATSAPDPSGACVVQSPSSCGTNGMCEAGNCQRYPANTPCADASCPAGSTAFTPGSACDGAGTCVKPTSTSCAPYKCGVAACKGTCAADADCQPPSVCAGGSCGLKSPGAACGDGTECATGFCTQGVCCRTACAGNCMSCALPSALGTCAPVPSGAADPTGSCKDEGAASCGRTGVCDGAGACQLYAAGTVCAAPTCPAGTSTATLARTCDGAGTCRAASTLPCAPFACNGATCASTCTSDSGCTAPAICDPQTNLCGNKKRLGQTCGSTDECITGNFCVDGVCCGASSCGTCQSCNIAGQEGSCANVAADDADPHARCTPAPPCGRTGACNGAGSCKLTPATTVCGASSCAGPTFTPTGFCNGTGSCVQTPQNCSPFLCSGGACLASCGGDGDCVPGSSCISGTCGSLKENGTACTNDPQCQSGHCVGQVCCGTAGCPSCFSCSVPGSMGSCTPVPTGGSDPLGMCPVTAASTCGKNGTCDGAGGCALYKAGTVCAAAACKGKQNLAAASVCNGAGTCMAGAMSSCTPWACSGAACKTAPCSGDGDCAPSAKCTAGACQ